jgi:D-alanyl-D-alanine carboxypeptidase (penicillin-binding protein 5/6)
MGLPQEQRASTISRLRFTRAVHLLGLLLLSIVLVAGLVWLFAPLPSASALTVIARDKIEASPPIDPLPPPTLSATAAIVVDMDSGLIVFSHNANARLEMASTTKIMTAILVLESLPLDKEVTIAGGVGATAGSSLGLHQGATYTVEQLLYMLLVSSANDAAVALAQASAGSVKEFVAWMNAKAEVLGLKNTHFENPHGLHAENHFTSAKDLATLTQYGMENPVFRQIVSTRQYELHRPGQTEPLKLKNSNVLLRRTAWITGVKTGSTPYADYCLVASGTRDGVSLVCVLLGSANDDLRWQEGRALLDYGFSCYSRTVLVDRGELLAELPTKDELGRSVPLVASRTVVSSLFAGERVTRVTRVNRDVVLPVDVGDAFGTIEFSLDGKEIDSVDLVASQPVGQVTVEMLLALWQEEQPLGPSLDGLLRTASLAER